MLRGMFETIRPRALAPLCLLSVSLGFASACSGATAGTPDAVDAGGDTASKPDAVVDASDAAPPTDKNLIVEPDQGMMPFYTLISSAKHTLDMTMYELRDTVATGLLTTAASKGVVVRVILDQNLEMSDNTTAYNALAAGKVQVHWADPSYAATHQKTITVDGTTSAIMTVNFVSEDYPTSRDFALLTTSSADVAAIEKTFDADFTNTAITPPVGTNLVWSPTSSQSSLLGIIGGAKSSLLIENEEMSDQVIVQALVMAASQGVDVKVAMTASKEWDTSFSALKVAGAHVVTYSKNASLYIHAKVIVADYGKSTATAFLGSENFSNASLTENRELGVITSDPGVMAVLDATLSSDYAGGTPY